MLIAGFVIIQTVIFLVVFLILRKMMIQSTTSAVNRLKLTDQENVQRMTEVKKKIEELEKEYDEKQAALPRALEKEREEAKKKIQEERNRIVAEAREEGQRILEAARMRKERSEGEAEKEFNARALRFAEKIIRESLSETFRSGLNEKVVDDLLQEVEGMEMGHVPDSIQEAEAVLPQSLTAEQMKRLKRLLEAKLGRPIGVRETIRKEMGGGLLLRIGSLVVDGSLENLLRGVAGQLKKD